MNSSHTFCYTESQLWPHLFWIVLYAIFIKSYFVFVLHVLFLSSLEFGSNLRFSICSTVLPVHSCNKCLSPFQHTCEGTSEGARARTHAHTHTRKHARTRTHAHTVQMLISLAGMLSYLEPKVFQVNLFRNLYFLIINHWNMNCWSQWPRGLRYDTSLLFTTLGSWTRIALQTWMSVHVSSVFAVLCVDSDHTGPRGPADSLWFVVPK
jgi:hypothetical protein